MRSVRHVVTPHRCHAAAWLHERGLNFLTARRVRCRRHRYSDSLACDNGDPREPEAKDRAGVARSGRVECRCGRHSGGFGAFGRDDSFLRHNRAPGSGRIHSDPSTRQSPEARAAVPSGFSASHDPTTACGANQVQQDVAATNRKGGKRTFAKADFPAEFDIIRWTARASCRMAQGPPMTATAHLTAVRNSPAWRRYRQ